MEEKLREYIETIFSTVPCTVKAVEVKEEILQNLIDKYRDLISEGKSEQAAYNIAVASIGDINELLGSIAPKTDPVIDEQKQELFVKSKQRNALFTAIAVALYILCPVPCIILGDAIIGPVLLFVMVAIATGLIIYKSMTKYTYIKSDDTMLEDFKQWKHKDDERTGLRKAINSALWSLILIIYFIISFATGAWHLTWLIFLVGAAIEGIIKAIFELTPKK